MRRRRRKALATEALSLSPSRQNPGATEGPPGAGLRRAAAATASTPTCDSLEPMRRLKNCIPNDAGDVLVTVGTGFRKRASLVIHRRPFHLFIRCFLPPWAESCLCKRGALLVIQGYNDSPSTVPPGSIKGHSFTGVTLTHQNTKTAGKLISSALPGAVLKSYFAAVERFIICCTCPQCVCV